MEVLPHALDPVPLGAVPLANIEGQNRWERATNLLRRIEAVCGRDFAEQPTAPPHDPGHTVVG